LGTFFHRSLIVASNTAYFEKATKTKTIIDIIDTLLLYESKKKGIVLLIKESEMVKLYLDFIRFSSEHNIQCDYNMNSHSLESIRHGDLLYRVIEILDVEQMKKRVNHITIRIMEKRHSIVLSILIDGEEATKADEAIPFIDRGSINV
jgi:hypothetical protein